MSTSHPPSARKGDRTSAVAMIVREMGLTDAAVAERLKAVSFDGEDRDRVRGAQGFLASFAREGADAFIRTLMETGELRALLEKDGVADEIRALKHAHLVAMGRGEYGVEYATQRIELAYLYNSLGIDVRRFLGAYQNLLRALGLGLFEARRDDPAQTFQTFLSIQKVASFDVGLIVDTLIVERERTIQYQGEAIRELSTPVLQVRPGLLVLPVIGVIDAPRASQLTEHLLRAIRANRARVVVLDITGVAGLDSRSANHLLQTIEAARLMGSTTIISGTSPEVARTLVTIGVDLSRVNTVGDLQGGIEEGERLLGYQVTKFDVHATPGRG